LQDLQQLELSGRNENNPVKKEQQRERNTGLF
jgi:hypothetical protein